MPHSRGCDFQDSDWLSSLMWGVATCLLSASTRQVGKVPIHLCLLPGYGLHAPPQPEPEIPGREQE